jgi:hypothetical protein
MTNADDLATEPWQGDIQANNGSSMQPGNPLSISIKS